MSIWGRRDSEPRAGEARESQAEAHESQAEAHDTQQPAGDHQGEESAPAFWRAQGETPASPGRDPADAPPPTYGHVPDGPPPAGVPTTTTMGPTAAYGQQSPGEAPASATEVQEPTVAVAREPVVNAAQEAAAPKPPVTEAQEPTTEAQEPTTEAQEPEMAEAQELAGAEAQKPAVTTAQEQPATAAQAGAHDSGITAQRWSEILVAFVDDPRGSVKMAADAVDEAVDEFVNSVRARQRDLASSWQGTGADTEQLRTALREYRKLGQRVRQLDLGDKTGA